MREERQVGSTATVRAGKDEVLNQGSEYEEGGWIQVPFGRTSRTMALIGQEG